MFVTTSSYLYPMPFPLSMHPVDQYWRAVELSNPLPWFLITIRQYQSTGKRPKVTYTTRNVLIMEVAEVERLACHEQKNPIQFESALIVTPPCVNLTTTWQMEPLVAVWSADEPSLPEASVEICETKSGKKYVTSANRVPIAGLKNQVLRFKFPSRSLVLQI